MVRRFLPVSYRFGRDGGRVRFWEEIIEIYHRDRCMLNIIRFQPFCARVLGVYFDAFDVSSSLSRNHGAKARRKQGETSCKRSIAWGNMACVSAPGVISYGVEPPLHIARSHSALQKLQNCLSQEDTALLMLLEARRRSRKKWRRDVMQGPETPLFAWPGLPSTIFFFLFGGLPYWASELSVAGRRETQDRL